MYCTESVELGLGSGLAFRLSPRSSRLGYFVTIRSLADLVDAFAIIQLIKTSSVTTQVDDIIRPVRVYTKRIYDYESGKIYHKEPSIMFRAESDAFPMDIKPPFEYSNKQMLTLSNVAMYGTKVNVFVVCGEPTNRIGEVFLNWRGGGLQQDILEKADSVDKIRKVNQFVAFKIADIIGDELSREQERSFWEAVNSRCSFFTRTRHAVVIDDKLPQPTFAEDVTSFLMEAPFFYGSEWEDVVARINRGLRTRYNISMDKRITLRKDKRCNSKQIIVKVLGKTLRGREKCIYTWKENASLPACEHVKWALNVEATNDAFRLCAAKPMPQKNALPEKFVKPEFPTRQALYEAFATRSRYSDNDKHFKILGYDVYMGETVQPHTQPLVFCHNWEDDPGTLSEFINKYI